MARRVSALQAWINAIRRVPAKLSRPKYCHHGDFDAPCDEVDALIDRHKVNPPVFWNLR